MKVYLDDERPAPPYWCRVKTPEATIELLKTGNVTHISLDHDLGLPDNRTGYTVACWIERAAHDGTMPPASVSIHTANAGAYMKMHQAIENAEKYWKR